METKDTFFTDTRKKVQDYVGQRLLLFRLQVIEKVSGAVAGIVTGIIAAVLALFALLFLSIMAGYYFSALTDSHIWGFGIVAGIYLLLLVIVLALSKSLLRKSIINKMIHNLLDKTHDHETNDNISSAN